MVRRYELQRILEDLLGTRNVYFQPPANISMKYPAIVYERDAQSTFKANNSLYKNTTGYQVTVLDRNPDSEIPHKVARLPYASFKNHKVVDGLHHDVYSIYY